MFPWMGMMKMPLSGNVHQEISPDTSLLEINLNHRQKIDRDILTNIASYSEQLATISAAIVEIADHAPGEAVEKLRQLNAQIAGIKAKHSRHLAQQIKHDLATLQATDPAAYSQIIDSLESNN